MAQVEYSSSGKPIRRGPYPELTWPGVIVGYLIGSLIAIAIGYASLILGFSIEGSELAAILGFAILRGLLRRRSIVENNVNQSLASAVNAASAGMMFSVPALLILGYGRHEFNVPLLVLGCITGAVLGICFIIPLRKQMIDFERLPYPGGIAVATILKSPGAGMRKAFYMLAAMLVSGALHAWTQSTHGWSNAAVGASLHAPTFLNLTFYISLMTIGVGFLAGRGGFFFIVGGYVCYFILAPVLAQGTPPWPLDTAAADVPEWLRGTLFRPLGIGMLIGGAVSGVVLAFPLVLSAVRSMQQASKVETSASRDELPIRFLYWAIAAGFLVLLVIAEFSTPEMTVWRGAAMAVLGTLWIWMSGVILSECIGRTNWSPLSGMTLIGITILIYVASGMGDRATVVSSVIVGAAMCVAMSQATDLMLDLKTGYLVGASPKKQQIAQLLGTWLGPILIIVVIFVLHQDSPLGGEKYTAPQGQALASMIDGILGGAVPTNKYIAGAALGALLSASGIGGLGVLVGLGFYLPFNIVLTYSIGTGLRLASDRFLGKAWSEDVGIPCAAGLIVGEALVGVGVAVVTILMGGGS